MIGKTLGHFKILERIGTGGMGEVYRAHDEHLDRDVALKVLLTGANPDPAARKHFRKEALTLAKLKHAHIGAIHDFSSEEDIDFLVMELVPGTDLAEKIERGALPENELVQLGMQIASALEEAHEHGIVHRDLKPRNIMLTPKGDAKVLDFGLAKLTRPATELTTVSMATTRGIAGTLPYMAPEQLRGHEADARVDVYALGVTLYEMATGQRPFMHTNQAELVTAILHAAPLPPTQINPQVSEDLERVLLKALEKDPAHRYQTAQELHDDLARLSAGLHVASVPHKLGWARGRTVVIAVVLAMTGTLFWLDVGGLKQRLFGSSQTRITSIAVLPFTNLSGQEDQELFADGITDGLITNLGKLGGLHKVTSRQSVMQFKATDTPLKEITEQLDVDAVLEGSVLLVGDRIQVRAKLIDGATERHLWGDSYEREVKDILSLLSAVTSAIVREINLTLSPQQESRLAEAREINPEAYKAYQRGLYLLEETSTHESIRHFQEAIRLEPGYAPAYAGLALSYNNMYAKDVLSKEESYPKFRAAAMKAVELDSSLAEARIALAKVHLLDWDFAEAEREFLRALEISPNNSLASYHYSLYLTCVGRNDEAIAVAQRFIELDPFHPSSDWLLGYIFYRTGQHEDAIRELKKTGPIMKIVLAWVYVGIGLYDEAVTAFQTAEQHAPFPSNPPFLATGCMVYALAGDRDKAMEYLGQLQELANTRAFDPINHAIAYFGLGDYDRTLDWLGQAVDRHEMTSIELKSIPFFTETLGSDPRYQELLRTVGFP